MDENLMFINFVEDLKITFSDNSSTSLNQISDLILKINKNTISMIDFTSTGYDIGLATKLYNNLDIKNIEILYSTLDALDSDKTKHLMVNINCDMSALSYTVDISYPIEKQKISVTLTGDVLNIKNYFK